MLTVPVVSVAHIAKDSTTWDTDSIPAFPGFGIRGPTALGARCAVRIVFGPPDRYMVVPLAFLPVEAPEHVAVTWLGGAPTATHPTPQLVQLLEEGTLGARKPGDRVHT